MRVLILGCGYVGRPLGAELVRQGHEVIGIRRHPDAECGLQPDGIRILQADVSDPSRLNELPGPFDWVVNTVSSSRGGIEEYRRAYLDGTRNLIEWLRQSPPRKYLYTSSTSVYGQTDASVVKETSPAEPAGETGRILVQTENLLLDAFRTTRFPAVILRVAGIYGPGRGHLFLQYLKNEARLIGDGGRFLNMIHRDDLVQVIVAMLLNGRPGEVYNGVDDEPVTEIHFFRWLSETLGKWMPPKGEPDPNRKRGLTNKRVSNRRLKMELGYGFRYPTFRQGYTEEIRRLEDAGELDIQPEPR